MIPNELIIIGGGASIKKGLSLGLHNKLKGRFTCGLNYAFNYFDCTYHCFVDDKFYKDEQSNLAKLPLIIGKSGAYNARGNTIDLPTATRYFRNLSGGTYSPDLTGIFALSLGIHLIDTGTIYLLGYDFGGYHTSNIEDEPLTIETKNILALDPRKRPITHFYQGEINHRGISKTSYYNAKKRPRDKFMPFIKDKTNNEKIKIYNVSPTSRIPSDIFEKIEYSKFFEKLESACDGECSHNMGEIRKSIRKKLNC